MIKTRYEGDIYVVEVKVGEDTLGVSIGSDTLNTLPIAIRVLTDQIMKKAVGFDTTELLLKAIEGVRE